MVAEFVIQLNPDIRFCGLRLLKGEGGYRVHFPKISGGGHGVTVSQELRAQITDIAKQFYEGLHIGQNTTCRQNAA